MRIALRLVLMTAAACGIARTTEEPMLAELEDFSKSDGLALGRFAGDHLIVRPFGGRYIQRRLNPSFLIASFASSGREVIGWGYPSTTDSIGTVPSVMIVDERGNIRSRTDLFANVSALALASSGDRFAIVATNRLTGFRGLQSVSLKGSAQLNSVPVEPTSPELQQDIAWSADGTQIGFSKAGKLMIWDVAVGRARAFAEETKLSWSPNGVWLAYVSQDSRLVMHNIAKGDDVFPSNNDQTTSAVHWSPDSRWFTVAERRTAESQDANCFSETRIIAYRVADFARAEVLNPCSLKPDLFGWVFDWRRWVSQ